MPSSSVRTQTITFTGDVVAAPVQTSGANTNSPAITNKVRLAAGANTINAPGAGTVPTALTILPPAGNTNLITLKGVAGDTGVPLHKTDPTTISLDSSFASLVLNAAAQTDITLIWS